MGSRKGVECAWSDSAQLTLIPFDPPTKSSHLSPNNRSTHRTIPHPHNTLPSSSPALTRHSSTVTRHSSLREIHPPLSIIHNVQSPHHHHHLIREESLDYKPCWGTGMKGVFIHVSFFVLHSSSIKLRVFRGMVGGVSGGGKRRCMWHGTGRAW